MAKYISWDLPRLKEDCDCFTLVQNLGLRKNKGFVENFCDAGHIKISHIEVRRDHCYCHSCKSRYSPYDIVKKVYENIKCSNISTEEIGEILADACSSPRETYIKNKGKMSKEQWERISKAKTFPLTDEELETIGLSAAPTSIPVVTSYTSDKWRKVEKVKTFVFTPGIRGISEDKIEIRKEIYETDSTQEDRDRLQRYDDGFAQVKNVIPTSIKDLYLDEPEVFNELILAKAQESMENARDVLDNTSGEFAAIVGKMYREKFRISRDVFLRFGGVEKKRAQRLFQIA